MKTAQNYVFIFRAPGIGLIRRTHLTRAGDAENAARKMTRIVAQETGAEIIECVYKGPEEQAMPQKLTEELKRAEISISAHARKARRDKEGGEGK